MFLRSSLSKMTSFSLKENRDGRRITVLGIDENAEGTHTLQLDENGNVRIAISPNEDGNKDFVEYKTVALRNIENLRATVYAASDTEHKNPLWEGTPSGPS